MVTYKRNSGNILVDYNVNLTSESFEGLMSITEVEYIND